MRRGLQGRTVVGTELVPYLFELPPARAARHLGVFEINGQASDQRGTYTTCFALALPPAGAEEIDAVIDCVVTKCNLGPFGYT